MLILGSGLSTNSATKPERLERHLLEWVSANSNQSEAGGQRS